MTLGQRLAELRHQKGVTQEQIAAALGISRILYSHYERDVATPPIWRLLQIARYHGLSVEQILEPVNPEATR